MNELIILRISSQETHAYSKPKALNYYTKRQTLNPKVLNLL